ncbi:hypothetical protein GA0115259_102848 [Streptomyces sp. MnatMP-M17]|nr:hypothetical protein GA0115259_102848 [Streptomyces sp. MnatMP-M17]
MALTSWSDGASAEAQLRAAEEAEAVRCKERDTQYCRQFVKTWRERADEAMHSGDDAHARFLELISAEPWFIVYTEYRAARYKRSHVQSRLTARAGWVTLKQSAAIGSTQGEVMRLRFLGIIPNTGKDDSPTIWLDEDSGDLLIQSYRATEEEVKACQEIGSIPGQGTDVPDHEAIIRLPKAMIQYIPRPDGGIADEASGA